MFALDDYVIQRCPCSPLEHICHGVVALRECKVRCMVVALAPFCVCGTWRRFCFVMLHVNPVKWCQATSGGVRFCTAGVQGRQVRSEGPIGNGM